MLLEVFFKMHLRVLFEVLPDILFEVILKVLFDARKNASMENVTLTVVTFQNWSHEPIMLFGQKGMSRS